MRKARMGSPGSTAELERAAEGIGRVGSAALARHLGPGADALVGRRLAALLGWPLTREAAVCLYTGLVTDTGRFQYSNTTAEVFALAQELAGFDLPIAGMSRQLFEEHRFAYLQLVASCLAPAELDPDPRFAATR